MPNDPNKLDLSLVIPMYEEEQNAPILHERIATALDALDLTSEIIYINDGSGDGTLEQLQKIHETDDRVVVIDLRRNFGQTAAMSAGFDYAQGEIIIAMDGDLQNDPADIAKLLAKIDEGYDVVSGWRVKRQDDLLLRKIPSQIANWLIGRVTHVKLHDYGCSLKAYRAEVIKNIRLYGEMHRFIPALASWVGAKVTEIPVQHHARQYGVAKYGISRTIRVILDLITVKFILSFSTRPLQIFGVWGLFCFLAGSGILVWQVAKKLLVVGYGLADKPIVLGGVLLVVLGAQMIGIGLLAELQVRTYHESQGKPIYVVRTTLARRREDRTQHRETAQ